MKKQLIKGVTMIMLVVGIAFAAAVVSANAQSTRKVAADVPFDFIVGDQTLSSGEYTLKATNDPNNSVLVQDADGKAVSLRMTFPITPKNRRGARLVFHRYGQRYFLAEIWAGSGEMGQHLIKSRQERAIERELATIASKTEQSESSYKVVEVATVRR